MEGGNSATVFLSICELSKIPKESSEAANPNITVVILGEWKLLKQYGVGSQIAGHNVQNLQHLYLEDAELLYPVYTDPSFNPYKDLGLILSACLTTDGRTTKAHPWIPLQTYYPDSKAGQKDLRNCAARQGHSPPSLYNLHAISLSSSSRPYNACAFKNTQGG